jgi:hypothetical protein
LVENVGLGVSELVLEFDTFFARVWPSIVVSCKEGGAGSCLLAFRSDIAALGPASTKRDSQDAQKACLRTRVRREESIDMQLALDEKKKQPQG